MAELAPMNDQNSVPSTSAASRLTIVVFLLILGLGAAVRFTHLHGESIWWDEFATVAFLEPPREYTESPLYDRWNQVVIRQSSPTLQSFLKQNRGLDPAAMPLYLAMEYYWNKHVYPSPAALRILSILIGLALLPLVFFTGRLIFNNTAGLIAMGCAALSPIHVQFSKEIRMYGLMTLLAILLVYSFIQILEGGKKRWWALNIVTVLLLSWTHPFALLLPFVQGLFWLLTRPCDLRRSVAWGLLTALAALPAAWYVLTIQFWGQDSTESWMRLPTVAEVINDIFADDATGATYQLNPTRTAFAQWVGMECATVLLSWRWVVGRVCVAAASIAMVWLILAVTSKKMIRKGWSAAQGFPARRFCWSFFLALWLVVPPLVLYALSAAWRPCHQPRYTVHASLALYLILGGAIAALPRRWLRVLGAACLVVFYGYQQMLVIGEPQHPDWRGASETIRREAQPDDLVLAHNWLWKRVFAYNLGPVPNVVSYGSSHDVLAEQAAFFLDLKLPSAGETARNREVWIVVILDYFVQGTVAELEEEMRLRGLQYDAYEFGGIQHVVVYHVRRDPSATPPYQPAAAFKGDAPKEFGDLAMEFWQHREYETAVLAAQNAIRINPNYARAWSYLGMALKELGRDAEALEAFQRAVALDLNDYPWSHTNMSELLLKFGRHEEAAVAANQALGVLPGDFWALTLLGRARLGLGDVDGARAAIAEALAKQPGDPRVQNAMKEVEQAAAEKAHP